MCLRVHRTHDDVIKWEHFPRYWPSVWGIHRSPVNSPHKGQWRRAFMFSLICAWINGCANNRETGDLRRHPAHYDVTVLFTDSWKQCRLVSSGASHWWVEASNLNSGKYVFVLMITEATKPNAVCNQSAIHKEPAWFGYVTVGIMPLEFYANAFFNILSFLINDQWWFTRYMMYAAKHVHIFAIDLLFLC